MAATAIRVTGLVKSFGEVKALCGVDFEVARGTVFGLLGPNGAGKTTAVRVLTTILTPDAGSAEVLGIDVASRPQDVRERIGLAGQYAAVDENLTGRENLRLIGKLTHLPTAYVHRRADDLLDRFGLTHAADRPASTYSGGMRRRLDLAAALVHSPPVLFLDEPTTGLDPASRQDLWTLVEELVDDGTTVLLTTQYLEEADRLAETLAVIDQGRVIAEGTPRQLKDELGGTVVEMSFAEVDQAQRALTAVQSLTSSQPIVEHHRVELPVDDGPKVAIDVLRALDAAGLEPTAFAVREPSLDDVFLSLTGHRAEAEVEVDGSTEHTETPESAAGGAS
jgi:daunorubicin resistance ABC transporter ATP-binding subunit